MSCETKNDDGNRVDTRLLLPRRRSCTDADAAERERTVRASYEVERMMPTSDDVDVVFAIVCIWLSVVVPVALI